MFSPVIIAATLVGGQPRSLGRTSDRAAADTGGPTPLDEGGEGIHVTC